MKGNHFYLIIFLAIFIIPNPIYCVNNRQVEIKEPDLLFFHVIPCRAQENEPLGDYCVDTIISKDKQIIFFDFEKHKIRKAKSGGKILIENEIGSWWGTELLDIDSQLDKSKYHEYIGTFELQVKSWNKLKLNRINNKELLRKISNKFKKEKFIDQFMKIADLNHKGNRFSNLPDVYQIPNIKEVYFLNYCDYGICFLLTHIDNKFKLLFSDPSYFRQLFELNGKIYFSIMTGDAYTDNCEDVYFLVDTKK